ncbi:DUF1553 domain-containing protein [Roseibacillus ishigakijimensis]|uniref:DUF1553 domain-containing protein n=1 Tax=Roseibacillus ishigakijimensis TaxID=454146 RepID=A0A934RJJ3_9BACT|nr:DUF1553 domain-containing protein [Roseibacillus ishigakijimensis]MBK1832837.1 DUF1553 domain-containing protein [Roseibacillus ishigakijimensis]
MRYLLFLIPCALASTGVFAQEVSYQTQVRPILSDKCYACHGPDEANNKADLRLDTPEAAYAALKEGEGHAIVPGDLENSVAWQRILATDPNEVMPPPESNLTLDEKEKALIRQWIEEGAKYEKHWAFTALPREVPVPAVKQKDWPANEIDHFILARLEDEKIAPSPAADPLRWLRRATFDLTGLPPTAEEIHAFEQEAATDFAAAKARATERLLASPAYGEHMAVAWLDAARYADSYGYQSDKLNTQWPYRDWVIEAFNKNLPYDEFVRWQLAGDLLEDPSREQKLATAFNRLHRLNNEGGAIFEEWRIENIADRVHTMGTAFLGLTMECCRCHDHKYDPISMRDYYSLFAFFNSIDENGLYDRTARVPSPTLLLPDEAEEKALQAARSELDAARENLQASEKQARQAFFAWLEQDPAVQPPRPGPTLDFSQGKLDKKVARFAENDHAHAPPLAFAPFSPDQPGVQAIRFDGDRYLSFEDIPSFDRWTPFSLAVTFRESVRKEIRATLAHHTRGTDAGFNGWDLILDNGYLEHRLYRVWPGNAMGLRTLEPIPANQVHHLVVTYDASDRAEGLRLFLNGKELATEILRDKKVKSAGVATQHGGRLALGSRWRDRGVEGLLVRDFSLHHRALSAAEIARLAAPTSELTREQLWDHFCLVASRDTREARQRLTQAVTALVEAEEGVQEIPVMEELPEPLEAHLLARGEYNAPTDESTRVERVTPAFLPPLEKRGEVADRLDLANWLLEPDHPLTARVFVNRLWANFFGVGLVSTPENFGLQGALPTHPELFDWLSRDFIAKDWDIKALCRSFVLSATYGQESRRRPELAERDPENLLLARAPAHRLDAEQIRDLALAASGLLNDTIGGPPVSPYQPGEDLWTESNGMSPPYQQSVGKALYRRSVYSVWKRTAPLPNMMAFDTSTREVCTVARPRTNTPLQALVLLNDVQFVEAARHLASRLSGSTAREQIAEAFLRLTGRPASERESEILATLYQSEHARLAQDPEATRHLLAHGDSPASESDHPAQLAAATSVCLAILNLDATIWKR